MDKIEKGQDDRSCGETEVVTIAITLRSGKVIGIAANSTGIGQPSGAAELACLGTIATDQTKPPKSPYLNAEEAAAYLGISITSLYGIVERRRIEPLRGPKRTYRFTTDMLDGYLKTNGRRTRR